MTTPTRAVRGLVPGARLVGVSMRDGAVGIAAVRSGAVTAHDGGSLVIVCSGGNAEPGTVAEIAAGIDHDRTMRQDWHHEP